jgi:hypothetical protein
MKLSEKYEILKKAAQADGRAVRNRETTLLGTYPEGAVAIDGKDLFAQIRSLEILGYEVHLRIVDSGIGLYAVKKMPSQPTEVVYA